jgi:prepilin peptidase CpaA
MIVLTVLVCVIAVVYDCKYRVIPDWLVLPYMVLGLAISLVQHGLIILAVFLAGFLLCEVLFRLGVFGGGDLKLLLGLAAVEGLYFCFWAFYFSLLASLPLFAFYMIKEKTWKVKVPYAVAILAGVIAAIHWEGIFKL